MNPEGKLADGVQLQVQPGVTTMVQHTTVNISAEPPNDYVVWSIFNFVHSNPCCLGLAALIFSIKARDRRMAGDLNGARSYASTARCLNIIATILVFVLILVFIIVFVKSIQALHSIQQSHNNNFPYYGGYK